MTPVDVIYGRAWISQYVNKSYLIIKIKLFVLISVNIRGGVIRLFQNFISNFAANINIGNN